MADILDSSGHLVSVQDIKVDSNDFAIAVASKPEPTAFREAGPWGMDLSRIGVSIRGCTVTAYSIAIEHDGMATLTIQAMMPHPGRHVPPGPLPGDEIREMMRDLEQRARDKDATCEEIAEQLVEGGKDERD